MRIRRPGISLVEVLVAIFIMGIGMLAVLVLFPLGALNMARALKDDRCSSIAGNAEAMAIAQGLKADSYVVTAMTNPSNLGAGYSLPDDNGVSFPAYVDPYFLYGNPSLTSVGVGTPIARIIPSYIPTGVARSLNIDRWFSLTDDLYFDTTGVPNNIFTSLTTAAPSPTVGPLQRQGYYTFAYMVRRQKTIQPNTAELYVIVYQNRAVQSPVMESVFGAVGNMGSTQLTLSWAAGATPPDLRRGSWLLDATIETRGVLYPKGGTASYVHAQFYKVMESINGANLVNNNANSVIVEIYPPLKDNLTVANLGQVVILDSAVEVFERGTEN